MTKCNCARDDCPICWGPVRGPLGLADDSSKRLRETVALFRIATALGVRLDPDKDNVLLLEELAHAAEQALVRAGWER
jgi:hypothetical protein